MDLESSSSKVNGKYVHGPSSSSKRMSRRNKCLLVTFAVILAVLLLMVILGLTVFKLKNPVTTVNSISLKDLQLGPTSQLNMTVDVNLSIKNPNKVGFKYTTSSALLKYRGELVGEGPIPAGEISSDQTLSMNITFMVLADELLNNSNADDFFGPLPLTAYTRLSGQVGILDIIKIHLVSSTTCDLTINVVTTTVANQTCHYKTKL
ncbi:uncharacterized protein LOC132315084 [Cornus florida]|uniref:uncharacterized protein LOC132315084 n=1 Tax=Cornus florida TaxID=4283 RepID=UPI00289FD7A7|nr:uncharacterized protein LOC132315084 [Cornus florida]